MSMMMMMMMMMLMIPILTSPAFGASPLEFRRDLRHLRTGVPGLSVFYFVFRIYFCSIQYIQYKFTVKHRMLRLAVLVEHRLVSD